MPVSATFLFLEQLLQFQICCFFSASQQILGPEVQLHSSTNNVIYIIYIINYKYYFHLKEQQNTHT